MQTGQPLPKTLRELLRTIKLNGWEARYSGGGHLKVYDDQGRWVTTTASTPGDYRGLRNFRADLKRAGLKATPIRAQKPQSQQPTIEYFSMDNQSTPKLLPEPSKANGAARPAKVHRGEALKTIRDAIAAHPDGRNDGLELDQVYELIRAKLPHVERNSMGSRLKGYADTGHLERVGFARYRVPPLPSQPTLPPPAPPPKEELPPQVEDDDLKALDEFLNSLARVEKIIRKHMHMANKLKDALKAFG